MLRIEQACRMAIEGRRAGRMIAAWAKSFDLSEPELQLMWCLRQEPGDGVDQTTIATRLAFSPAQVSVDGRAASRAWFDHAAAGGR